MDVFSGQVGLLTIFQVRCEFVPGEHKCRRCQAKNLPCTPRERKKRKPAESVTYLFYVLMLTNVITVHTSNYRRRHTRRTSRFRICSDNLINSEQNRRFIIG